MENYTPGEIIAFLFAFVLAAAGAVNTVGNALDKIAAAKRAAQAPNAEQDRRLHELEEWRTEVDRKLSSDKQQLDEIHDGMRVSHLAQLALLDHALNGNNIDQMQDAKDALQKYLANK